MNKIKENKTEVNFIYFKLDVEADKMYEVQGKSKINDCDMAIIRTAFLHGIDDIQQIKEQGKEFLNEKFPLGDWHYKLSNSGKHVFWKRQSLLRQRQNQIHIPFSQAA